MKNLKGEAFNEQLFKSFKETKKNEALIVRVGFTGTKMFWERTQVTEVLKTLNRDNALSLSLNPRIGFNLFDDFVNKAVDNTFCQGKTNLVLVKAAA